MALFFFNNSGILTIWRNLRRIFLTWLQAANKIYQNTTIYKKIYIDRVDLLNQEEPLRLSGNWSLKISSNSESNSFTAGKYNSSWSKWPEDNLSIFLLLHTDASNLEEKKDDVNLCFHFWIVCQHWESKFTKKKLLPVLIWGDLKRNVI